MPNLPRLSRAAWKKTPYATSTANNTQTDIERLLARHKVVRWAVMSEAGPNGRPAYGVRFCISERWYVICFETMNVMETHPDDLLRQAKRFTYHCLKAALEQAMFFKETGQSPEKAFFVYLETPAGQTIFDAAQPYLELLQSQGMPLLPKPA